MNLLLKLLPVVFLLITPSAHGKSFLGAVVGEAIGRTVGKSLAETDSFEQELVGMADRLNKKMPMYLDKSTRIDNIIPGPGRILTYNYTIVPVVSQDVDDDSKAAFIKSIQPKMTKQVCTNPDTKLFFKNGVTIIYYYRASDGGFIGKFELSSKDCSYDRL
jgi:hypothetical protein